MATRLAKIKQKGKYLNVFTWQQDCLPVKGRPPMYIYLVMLMWPWPWSWPHDLDTRPYPRYSDDVPA